MVILPLAKEEPCMDLVNENDCADGKLHCRPTATKALRTPIDGSAIIKEVISSLIKRDPDQTEFHQAAREVLESLVPVIQANPEFADNSLLERMVEPERTISFRVPWTDDSGATHVNRGYRVQYNSAIGPYKGRMRFHPSVNLSILKFLGFEQVFKNSLTGLSLGEGKGGSDFDPKGRSDAEVMRFCQSFMSELYRHIGSSCDVPAGDIGVGGREIGYMYGMYKKLRNEFSGVLIGKDPSYDGSLIRPEATGYGLVYFVREMLQTKGIDMKGARVAISGSGNVAQFAAEKVLDLGVIVVSMSDSSGFIFDADGISRDKLAWIRDLKNDRRGRLSEYAKDFPSVVYTPASSGKRMWASVGDVAVALPCATREKSSNHLHYPATYVLFSPQHVFSTIPGVFWNFAENEIDGSDAEALVKARATAVAEGANMPCMPEAVAVFQEHGLLFAPGKVSNAGGVGTSGLEMSQNSQRLVWTRDEVDKQLEGIMKLIHRTTSVTAKEYGREGDYVFGANAAGFVKVATAMRAQGIV